MAASFLLAALTCVTAVSAHGFVVDIIADGQTYKGYNPAIGPWEPDQGSVSWPNTATDLGYVAPGALGSSDIVCHRNSSNAKLYATVAAGSEITLRWNQWPDSHKGPIMDYLAPCNGECTTIDKSSLNFFKIAEKGQIRLGAGGGKTGYWAPDELLDNGLNWTVKIPEGIKPGNYVLRHEILALHSAYSLGGAQFYPQCINLRITGSGSSVPSGVAATQLYQANDPSVIYNIYNDEQNPSYKIPGPAIAI